MVSKKELMLIKKLVKVSNKNGLWKSEKELFKALKK